MRVRDTPLYARRSIAGQLVRRGGHRRVVLTDWPLTSINGLGWLRLLPKSSTERERWSSPNLSAEVPAGALLEEARGEQLAIDRPELF